MSAVLLLESMPVEWVVLSVETDCMISSSKSNFCVLM